MTDRASTLPAASDPSDSRSRFSVQFFSSLRLVQPLRSILSIKPSIPVALSTQNLSERARSSSLSISLSSPTMQAFPVSFPAHLLSKRARDTRCRISRSRAKSSQVKFPALHPRRTAQLAAESGRSRTFTITRFRFKIAFSEAQAQATATAFPNPASPTRASAASLC